MDINRLINELKGCEGDIFQDWLRQMHKAGYDNPRITSREDFHKKFCSVLSALEACGREPRLPLFGGNEDSRPFLVRKLVEDARLGQARGLDLDFFLGDFKAMISCMEDRISVISLPQEQKTSMLLKLRRIADLTEMAVIAGQRKTGAGEGAKNKKFSNSVTSEKILSALFMSVGEGILLVDEDFEIVKANQHACEMFGMQQQNIVGTDIRSLTMDAGADLLARYFEELIEGQRKNASVTCLYVDGKTFPATVTVTRSDLDGKKHWSLVVRDDTNQNAMETQLREEKRQIEEMNLTLKTVMKSIEQDRKDFENRVASKIRTSLLPGLRKIDDASEESVRKSYLAAFEEQLLSLTTGFEKELDAGLLKLTKTELEVCRLVQAGCSSKDICDAMNISFDTIQTHRKNIRRKLSLNGKKLNLHAFLTNRAL
ncbi:MAG TPA: PAS domain S-box protein [Smithella sp.]|nr:PAS domain S-box protein [Smithella sp.]